MKKKHFKEGVDYTIHEYKRKMKRTSEKAICPICSQCKNRRICLNRKSKETMDRCSKCKNCKDAENCDKFYIYSEYRAEILRLGTNPNNGKPIRQQLTGTNKEELVKRVIAQIIKNQEEGVKETAYRPNEDNLLFIRSDNKYYEDGQVNSAFKRICMNAGIRVKNSKHKKYSDKKGFYYVNQKTSDVNTHMLRHSFATRGIEAGMTSTVLKDILGHSDIQTTINIYGDVFSYYQNSKSEKAEKYLEEQMNKYKERFKLIEKNSREKVVNL